MSQKIASQKKANFLEAYDKYSEAIYRHCYFRIFNRERAKELMQEAFTRTWESISKGADILNIKAFLYRTATNLVIDESRKKKTDSLDSLHERGFDPSSPKVETAYDSMEIEAVLKLIKQLDEKYREVVMMRYVNDLTPKEISAALGISENVVSVRIHRAIKELRKIMNTSQ